MNDNTFLQYSAYLLNYWPDKFLKVFDARSVKTCLFSGSSIAIVIVCLCVYVRVRV